jgi:hypothetical protein
MECRNGWTQIVIIFCQGSQDTYPEQISAIVVERVTANWSRSDIDSERQEFRFTYTLKGSNQPNQHQSLK